jgi:hypothetical protein
VRLPERIHITQTNTMVSFEDSTGAVLQEIATVPAQEDTFPRPPGAAHLLGAWNGRQLELSREAWGGAKATETWSLEDSGAALVSVLQIRGGPMGDVSTHRVYRRVSTP